MAKAVGRRPDEAPDRQSEEHGAEGWALALVAALMVLALIGLMVLAAG